MRDYKFICILCTFFSKMFPNFLKLLIFCCLFNFGPLIVGQDISNSKCISPDIKIENSGSWDGFPSKGSVENNTEVGISRAYFNCTSSHSSVDWILDIHPVVRYFSNINKKIIQRKFNL